MTPSPPKRPAPRALATAGSRRRGRTTARGGRAGLLLALLTSVASCGGGAVERRPDPGADDEPVVIREGPEPAPEHPDCPPVPCMGPFEDEATLLGRVGSRAAELAWRDAGGEGPIPESGAEASWLAPPVTLEATDLDRAGVIGVSGLSSPRGSAGEVFVGLRGPGGWYGCEAGGATAGEGGSVSTEALGDPTAEPFGEGLRGVAARFRIVVSAGGTAELVDHLAVCAAADDRPGCYGVPVIGRGEGETPTASLSATFDGEGRLVLEPEPGVEGATARTVGAHPIRGLRCALDDRSAPEP